MQKRILRSPKGTQLDERKRRQWMQIELAGRAGFSASKHSMALEKKLEPLVPKILTLILAKQYADAQKATAPVTVKLAATFALMALKVKDKTKRQELYNWAVRNSEKCNKEQWTPSNTEIEELVNICGSPENADKFWEQFTSNSQKITNEILEILKREAKKHGLSRG
ncbi:MAG: hypothetical protein PHD95_06325 [Candidatus ainarchaeum sp.]|nr:hypothetical protein [Candidatus ainarchaeum sp.]